VNIADEAYSRNPLVRPVWWIDRDPGQVEAPGQRLAATGASNGYYFFISFLFLVLGTLSVSLLSLSYAM